MSDVRAFGSRTNNAQLMADCAELGYLDGHVLDLTYGLGRFWKIYRPEDQIGELQPKTVLYTNDLDPKTKAQTHHDFTDMPTSWTGLFDAVVFDPPYKLNGTGGSHPSDKGYGVDWDYLPVDEKMDLIYRGFAEAVRLSRRFVLVKCQDQVVSGKKVWQTDLITMHAMILTTRIRKRDVLHVQGYRPQPPGRRQVHARQDYSTLLVFEVGT